jgi:hypothetical protein
MENIRSSGRAEDELTEVASLLIRPLSLCHRNATLSAQRHRDDVCKRLYSYCYVTKHSTLCSHVAAPCISLLYSIFRFELWTNVNTAPRLKRWVLLRFQSQWLFIVWCLIKYREKLCFSHEKNWSQNASPISTHIYRINKTQLFIPTEHCPDGTNSCYYCSRYLPKTLFSAALLTLPSPPLPSLWKCNLFCQI